MRYLEEGSYFCFTDQGSKPRSRPGLAALASLRCGGSPPLYPPPPLESKEEDRVAPPVDDWEGDSHPQFECNHKVECHFDTKRPHRGA